MPLLTMALGAVPLKVPIPLSLVAEWQIETPLAAQVPVPLLLESQLLITTPLAKTIQIYLTPE